MIGGVHMLLARARHFPPPQNLSIRPCDADGEQLFAVHRGDERCGPPSAPVRSALRAQGVARLRFCAGRIRPADSCAVGEPRRVRTAELGPLSRHGASRVNDKTLSARHSIVPTNISHYMTRSWPQGWRALSRNSLIPLGVWGRWCRLWGEYMTPNSCMRTSSVGQP